MIYKFIPDTLGYLGPFSIAHPLPQYFHQFFQRFGEFGFEMAAITQIAFIIYGAILFNKNLEFKNNALSFLSLAVLMSPALYWGRQIGSDALGYGFMLLAFTYLGRSPRAFLIFSVLASLCRLQYLFLFGGFFLSKKSRCYALAICVIAACAFQDLLGFSGKFYRVHAYLECAAPGKPTHISHAEYFNDAIGGDNVLLQIIPKSCSVDNEGLLPHWKMYLRLIGSKIYDAFRFHQIAILVLLLLMPNRTVTNIVKLNLMHYALVILTASLYFQQYTFMIEMTLISVIIRAYEDIRYARFNP